jgi:putative transposase
MDRERTLTDTQWDLIGGLLPGRVGTVGVTAKDNRLFIDAILWIARTGAPWRDLPRIFGRWNSVFKRYESWAKKDRWTQIFDILVDNPDFEYLMIYSTIVRAHQHAAGGKGGLKVRQLVVPEVDAPVKSMLP